MKTWNRSHGQRRVGEKGGSCRLLTGLMMVSLAAGTAIFGLEAGYAAVSETPHEGVATGTAYRVTEVANGATIRGTVSWAGDDATPGTLPVSKDVDVCGQSVTDPGAAIGADGGVQWAFVYLEDISEGKDFAGTAYKIDNDGCMFAPHVQGIPAGTELQIVNKDVVLHTVRGSTGPRTLWNLALPIANMSVKKAMPNRTGVVRFACDVHEWMSGWVHVMEHPYFAATNADGTWLIADVPAGSYTLVTWHERLGTVKRQIEVSDGQTIDVDVVLEATTGSAPAMH